MTPYDLVWTVGSGLAITALAVALSQLLRASFSILATFLWLLVIIAIPFIGALAWFAFGPRAGKRRHSAIQGAHGGV